MSVKVRTIKSVKIIKIIINIIIANTFLENDVVVYIQVKLY